MNILVIGSGGREHAVIKAIKKNPNVETIWCLPGNGGIAADATCVPIGAKDIDGIVKFASENKVVYAIVLFVQMYELQPNNHVCPYCFLLL